MEEYIPLYHLSSKKGSPPLRAQVQVDDKLVTMEVDTGAAKSLMSEATFYGLWPGWSLYATDVRLCSYSRESIPVLGCVQVKVTYHSGHSFRIGAAITAVQQGLGDATVQMLGRWRSGAYKTYVRTPREQLAGFS